MEEPPRGRRTGHGVTSRGDVANGPDHARDRGTQGTRTASVLDPSGSSQPRAVGGGRTHAPDPALSTSELRILGRLVSSDTIRVMAMTLRLTDADDRLLTERARSEGRSKQELAREAIHAYLTDQVRRLEDLEDELALARYQLRQQLGEVTYVSQAEARSALGLPPSSPRSASA